MSSCARDVVRATGDRDHWDHANRCRAAARRAISMFVICPVIYGRRSTPSALTSYLHCNPTIRDAEKIVREFRSCSKFSPWFLISTISLLIFANQFRSELCAFDVLINSVTMPLLIIIFLFNIYRS